MKYNEFIEKFNQLCRFDGSEADRCYAQEDQGTIKVFCRDSVNAKLPSRSKYWEFYEYSAFDSERLKLMAELSETDPKFRSDTLWVLLNGRPQSSTNGLAIYNYFRADNNYCHLDSERQYTYESFKKHGAYTVEELAKLKAELKVKGELDLLEAVKSLSVKLDEVENVDEDY